MTSKAVAALLADLEVTRSHSRPRVSNDNPYSESLFKTLKYGPEFPDYFGSLTEARQFMDTFANWYNHEHRHTGIGLHTPPMCTSGWPPTRPPRGGQCWPTPAPDTRTASARQRAEDPRPAQHRLGQPTNRHPASRHDSRLTPDGLIHLEKFRHPKTGFATD